MKNSTKKKLDESHRITRNKFEREIFFLPSKVVAFSGLLSEWRIEVESFAMYVAVDRTVLIHAEEAACRPQHRIAKIAWCTLLVVENVIDMEVQKMLVVTR